MKTNYRFSALGLCLLLWQALIPELYPMANFTRLHAQTKAMGPLAVTFSAECDKDTRLSLEIANSTDWVYIDLGDGVPKEYMVSDLKDYAMRVYIDAKVKNPTIKVYAHDLYLFKAPSNGITSLTLHHAPKLTELILFENRLQAVELEHLPLLERLDLANNQLASVSLGKLPSLNFINLNKNNLTSVDLSANTKLKTIRLSDNNLGKFTLKNMEQARELSIDHASLTSLTIDNCPNLEQISCAENQLDELDFKQDLNLLDELDCSGNSITSLPFIEMPKLTRLNLNRNKMKWVDVSFLPELVRLQVAEVGAAGALNLDRNPKLREVDASHNSIETLQIKDRAEIQILDLSYNQLTRAELNNCPKLDRVNLSNNNLDFLILVQVPGLTDLDISDNHLSACALDDLYESLPDRIEEYFSGRIYVSNDDTKERENPGAATSKTSIAKARGWKTYVTRDGWQEEFTGSGTGCMAESTQALTFSTATPIGEKIKLTVSVHEGNLEMDGLEGVWVNGQAIDYIVRKSHITLQGQITSFKCENARLQSIDLSQAPEIESLLVSWNELATLDLAPATKLKELRCSWNKLSTLNIEKNPQLEVLFCSKNQIPAIDAHNHPHLRELYGSFNPLQSLHLDGCTALQVLSLEETGLTALELSEFKNLKYLEASGNKLTKIDLSKNPLLETLALKKNQLTQVNLDSQEKVVYLDLSENQLKEINLKPLKQLGVCYLYNNQLPTIDFSGNPLITELSIGNNQLSQIDLKPLEQLASLSLYGNQIGSLNLSNNRLLLSLVAGNNRLTELDLSQQTLLSFVDCFSNQITEKAMESLIESLPAKKAEDDAEIYLINTTDPNEKNVCTVEQVAHATTKQWRVMDYKGDFASSEPYQGSTAVEAITTATPSWTWDAASRTLSANLSAPGVFIIYNLGGEKVYEVYLSTPGWHTISLEGIAPDVYVVRIGPGCFRALL